MKIFLKKGWSLGKKINLLILIGLIGLIGSSPVFAQDAPSSASSSSDQGILDSLAGGISQLISGNNPVRLENPQNNFPLDQPPLFTLITPASTTEQDIKYSIIRKSTNTEVQTTLKKVTDNKYQISFSDQYVISDQYVLDITVKESFFYNRHIILDFTWGPSTSSGSNSQTSWLKSFLEEKPDHKNMKIVKTDANSVHFLKPDGKIEANFTEKPINYQENGQWRPIDTALKEKDGMLTGDGVPVKITKTGEVKVDNSKHSQKTLRFGYFNPDTKTFSSLTDLPEGKIEGNQFIRETKEFRHVLTLLDTGLKEELTLFSPPTINHEPSTTNQDYLVLETEVTGIDLPDGWVDEFKIKDTTFPLPETKDAAGKKIETKRYAKKVEGKQYIYTGIPVATLQNSPYPLTIDPDFTGDTADGYVRASLDYWSWTWAERNDWSVSEHSSDAGGANIQLENSNDGDWMNVDRGLLKFNTSSIGAGATVTQVNLTMTPTVNTGSYHYNIVVKKADWTEPIASNAQANYAAVNSAATDVTWRSTNGATVGSQFASPNMDTTRINVTGNTYYGLQGSMDINGTEPSDWRGFAVGSADHTTASYRPFLTITYTGGGGGGTDTIKMKGVKMHGVKMH